MPEAHDEMNRVVDEKPCQYQQDEQEDMIPVLRGRLISRRSAIQVGNGRRLSVHSFTCSQLDKANELIQAWILQSRMPCHGGSSFL